MKKTLVITALISLSLSGLGFADAKADAMTLGQQKYLLCAACHGIDGKGTQPAPGLSMAPSFLDSVILKEGSAELITAVMLKGIKKENPAEFMGQMMLPLGASMPDADVAAIVTFVRNTYGGHDEVVMAEQVAEWRTKYPTAEGQMERKAVEEMAKAKE